MTKEEVLNSQYISAKELKILMPQIGINGCRNIIVEAREKMVEKGYYIPKGKTLIALTSEVKKMLGIRS